MAKFDKQIATAKRLIEKNGVGLTFNTLSESAYDPVSGTYTGLATEYNAICVVLNIDTKEKLTLKNLDNTLINKEFKRLLISPEISRAPKQSDYTTISGKKFNIIESSALNPADDGVILYKAIVAE